MGKLENKIALITGSNSGIGETTAKLFAAEGATVILTARRVSELERMQREITDAGGTAVYFPGDITVTQDVDDIVEKAIQRFGRIDILVNNAGIGDKHTPTVKLTDEFWENVIDTNLTGTMRFCRAVLPHMVKFNRGTIVNIASIGGTYYCAGASYSCAKAGVIALTKNLAIQYYGSGIRVNCVSPGSTQTPLFNPENFDGADEEMLEITKRTHYHQIEEMMKPEEQAYTILFLACDDSSGINGENIVVDYGGRL